MRKRAPSAVRDMMESRIRKFARTYSVGEQLEAVDEAIEILQDYRAQLVERIGG